MMLNRIMLTIKIIQFSFVLILGDTDILTENYFPRIESIPLPGNYTFPSTLIIKTKDVI